MFILKERFFHIAQQFTFQLSVHYWLQYKSFEIYFTFLKIFICVKIQNIANSKEKYCASDKYGKVLREKWSWKNSKEGLSDFQSFDTNFETQC